MFGGTEAALFNLRDIQEDISSSPTAATYSWSQATKWDGLHQQLPFMIENKKINDDNGTHYCFTSEQEHNQMFHICSCPLDISMTMCRLCFNAAQLTAWERGQRPQKWPAWPVPDVPACCRNKSRSPAFYKSHPMSSLPDREEMLSPPNPPMTPRIPSQHTNDLTLLFVDISAKMFSFVNFYLLFFVTKGFQTCWSGPIKRSQDNSEGSDIINLGWLTSFFHTKWLLILT